MRRAFFFSFFLFKWYKDTASYETAEPSNFSSMYCSNLTGWTRQWYQYVILGNTVQSTEGTKKCFPTAAGKRSTYFGILTAREHMISNCFFQKKQKLSSGILPSSWISWKQLAKLLRCLTLLLEPCVQSLARFFALLFKHSLLVISPAGVRHSARFWNEGQKMCGRFVKMCLNKDWGLTLLVSVEGFIHIDKSY